MPAKLTLSIEGLSSLKVATLANLVEVLASDDKFSLCNWHVEALTDLLEKFIDIITDGHSKGLDGDDEKLRDILSHTNDTIEQVVNL